MPRCSAAVRELHKVAERPVPRIDAVVVANVVAVIFARGRLKRHQPDRRHAHSLQIVQPADQTLKIADAVAIGIHIGGDRQAIDDRVLVPEIIDHVRVTFCSSR